MFKKKLLFLNKKEKKHINLNKLKNIFIKLKIIRHFIYLHNDKIKYTFIKLLCHKIFNCKCLFYITLDIIASFLKKYRNIITYDILKGKLNLNYLQHDLFRVLNLKTQLNNRITFLIDKIIYHSLEKGNIKNNLKNCDTKKIKNILLEVVNILLDNYKETEKEKKEKEKEKKKIKKEEKIAQIMNNKNDEYILLDAHEKGNTRNLHIKYISSNKINKNKGNILSSTYDNQLIINENEESLVENTRDRPCNNKFSNTIKKSCIEYNSKNNDSNIFYECIKQHFLNSEKEKKSKRKEDFEKSNKEKIDNDIYYKSYSYSNINDQIISNCFLKKEIYNENQIVEYKKTKENYIYSDERKDNTHNNKLNTLVNKVKKITCNEMLIKKSYKFLNKNKRKGIKNLVCANHVDLHNLNCCTCKFICSINKVYCKFKRVNIKKESDINEYIYNCNKNINKLSLNYGKWKNKHRDERDNELDKYQKRRKKTKKKEKKRKKKKIDKIKKEKILNDYANEKENKRGILKDEKKIHVENKKVRINIYNDKNKKNCPLKKNLNNIKSVSDEHETVEAYLINFCRNNNNIAELNENTNENDDINYIELDVYMDEYRGNLENLSMTDNIYDLNPIHLATKEGNIQLIKKFLKSGIDVNSKTRVRKFTPLHLSASKGDKESLKFLIDNNANINALSSDNETPLWCASISNNLDVCKYLLEKGALINLNIDKKYDSALHAASMMGNFEIVKLLIENGADITCLDLNLLEPVHYASFEGHKGIVKYLIHKQIEQSLNKKMEEMVSILKKYNVYSKNLEIHYYLKYKSILKKRITSKILCCAITSGNYKIVDTILKKGADPNYFDVRLQLFPIHAASITGSIKIFKNLVIRGANIFMKTNCDNLPIDLTEDDEIKKYIIQHSRKINLRNAWIIRLKKKNHIISLLSYDVFYYLCTFL